MRRGKTPYVAMFMASILLSVQLTAYAAVPTEAYTSAPYIRQLYSNWCWAACSVSVVRALGLKNSDGTDYQQAQHVMNAIGNLNNVTRKLDNINSDFSRLYSLTTSYSQTGTIGYSTVKSQVFANKPIFVNMYYTGLALNHAILLVGYENTTSAQNVKVMDPDMSLSTYLWTTYGVLLTNYRPQTPSVYGEWMGTIYNFTK